MDDRLPRHRLGLGVGFDLPWGGSSGFVRGPDRLAPRLARFWERYRGRFDVAFGSWQPRSRARLHAEDYHPAWDDLWRRAGPLAARSLHHTALNLGSPEVRDLGPLLAFTEGIVERHDLRWVNEDLGLWAIRGHRMPYPLPPLLTDDGARTCIRNAEAVNRVLSVPLLLEFPGFGDGFSPVVGSLDAYDHFRRVVEDSGCGCTLDVGHLLSWRWQCGHRGAALLDGLERLPLDRCFEIHLSGCTISGDRFYDAHHGVLLAEQLELLDRLLAVCPRLSVVTFEDPLVDGDGELVPRCAASLAEVEVRVGRWRAGDPAAPVSRIPAIELRSGGPSARDSLDGLWAMLREPEALGPAAMLGSYVGRRRAVGVGALVDAFPATLGAHADPDGLIRTFVASPAWEEVREVDGQGMGPCIEEAFASFCAAARVGDAVVRQAELLQAVGRALVVDPEPSFRVPGAFRRVPGGWVAVLEGDPARVFAAVDGRLITGTLPTG